MQLILETSVRLLRINDLSRGPCFVARHTARCFVKLPSDVALQGMCSNVFQSKPSTGWRGVYACGEHIAPRTSVQVTLQYYQTHTNRYTHAYKKRAFPTNHTHRYTQTHTDTYRHTQTHKIQTYFGEGLITWGMGAVRFKHCS